MTENEKQVYEVLNQLKIPYTQYEHVPVYTIQQLDELNMDMKGKHCKNLFVRNDKGDKHYLIIVSQEKRADLKDIAKQIGSSRLGFASEERLMKHLGLTPGAVTPFGLLNDEEKKVTVLVDEDLKNSIHICFHANVNTSTVSLLFDDFIKFWQWNGNEYQFITI